MYVFIIYISETMTNNQKKLSSVIHKKIRQCCSTVEIWKFKLFHDSFRQFFSDESFVIYLNYGNSFILLLCKRYERELVRIIIYV